MTKDFSMVAIASPGPPLGSSPAYRDKSLTAVALIRAVHTVHHVVTSVSVRDTLTLSAGELVWAAGATT